MAHGSPERLSGKWNLRSASAIDQDGRSVNSAFGPCPIGRFSFAADRLAMIVSDGRPVVADGQIRGRISFQARAHVDNNALLVDIDASTDTKTVGKTEMVSFNFQEDQLHLILPLAGNQYTLIWIRDSDKEWSYWDGL